MAVTTIDLEKVRLRSYLSPTIHGKNTDAVLEALAGPSSYLVNNLAAASDQMYIATASGRYLDERLTYYNIIRPAAVGLSDDVYRTIGTEVKNRKQVRDLINNLLSAIFGDEYVRGTNQSRSFEPYNLMDGDTLIVNFDDANTIPIQFKTSQFASIAAATAQEVADSITKYLRSLGYSGTAISKDDGNGPYVEIISDTIGASSSVTVLGGRAQNELNFDSSVAAGGNMSTQYTLSLRAGGIIRFTWTGGANPQLGKVSDGNYVNVFGGGFASSANEGSYTITASKGGVVGVSYFEVLNPLGTTGIVVQGSDDAIRFFNPVRKVLASRSQYAAVYQTEARILQIFLPAATKVVRRDRRGSAHFHDTAESISLLPDQEGPYIYDLTQPFTISATGTLLAQELDGTMPRIVSVDNAADFPDQQGNLILGYGTERQEGPIPYIARPSSNTLLLSPAYTIRNVHPTGTDVALVAQKAPVSLSRDGSDFEFFITGITEGRLYAQSLINSVTASGITVVFVVLLPNSIGLGKSGTIYDENPQIWGD